MTGGIRPQNHFESRKSETVATGTVGLVGHAREADRLALHSPTVATAVAVSCRTNSSIFIPFVLHTHTKVWGRFEGVRMRSSCIKLFAPFVSLTVSSMKYIYGPYYLIPLARFNCLISNCMHVPIKYVLCINVYILGS